MEIGPADVRQDNATRFPFRGRFAGRTLDAEALRREVARVDWWHEIDLGHGIVTPGRGNGRSFLEHVGMPADLTGRSVLDIGTFDGMVAFEAERRGAARVLALDHRVPPGFELAHQALRSRVEFVEMEADAISPQAIGQFDVVFYLGVIYHQQNPFAALQRVRSVARDLVVIETDSSFDWTDTPVAEFRGSAAAVQDPALNWWIPNAACLVAMCRAAGFREARQVGGPAPPPRGAVRRLLRKVPSQFGRRAGTRLRSLAPGLFGPNPRSRLVVHAQV